MQFIDGCWVLVQRTVEVPQTQALDCVVAASFRYSVHGGAYSRCGPCCLFEDAWSMATGKLLTLSERERVDCVTVGSTYRT